MTEPRGPNDADDYGTPDPADLPPPESPSPESEPARPAPPTAVPPEVAKPIVVPTKWHKRWSTRLMAALIILPLLAFAVWAAVTLNVVYERGEKYGYVQNFAKKGLVCATFEGELAMTNVPSVAPELFAFSVRSDVVAADIQQSTGKRVALKYERHKNVPTSCFGKTDYLVTGVRVEEP